jgi:polyribonucleotide nucleotidyltransferase
MKNEKIFEIDISGRKLKATFSDLAEQANGSCLVQYGNTIVLSTAVMGKENREGMDFFPLSVEYTERFYAAGKILGSRFIRRESRPSDSAILSGRLIDRSIRPLFNQDMRREVQVVITVLSVDEDNDPDFVAMIAASLSLAVSDIPWNGPISGIRIGKDEKKELKSNPIYKERANDDFDVFVSAIDNKVNMLEVGANQSKEEEVLSAIKLALEETNKLNQWQNKIVEEIGKKKQDVAIKRLEKEMENKIIDFLKERGLEEAIYIGKKEEMKDSLREIKNEMKEWLRSLGMENEIGSAFDILEKQTDKMIHKNILENEKRPDGRKLNEIRNIYCKTGILPKQVHGSGLFVRGQTQALSLATLASPSKELTVENIEPMDNKRFMHHYNFPPYSTGETKPMRAPSRREIGHGSLAEKALIPVIPDEENFPYTIRVVSEILSSNGSSSMAATCGLTLSLMDAGVPIKKPVAGIAMGVIMKDDKDYKILTDIQGPEDHYGDMDFKVAGTSEGITACQLDVKIKGITIETIEETFKQAKIARLEILEKIKEEISEPRKELSPFAPKITVLKIDPDQIGMVIGSGGKTIKEMSEKTETEISIEDDGTIFISGLDNNSIEEARKIIESITKEYEVGEIVEGKIVRIMDFGAIVELGPNKDGMIHISEISHERTENVSDVLKTGDIVKVKIIKIDDEGKIGLSIKALEERKNNPMNNPHSNNPDYNSSGYAGYKGRDYPERDKKRFRRNSSKSKYDYTPNIRGEDRQEQAVRRAPRSSGYEKR